MNLAPDVDLEDYISRPDKLSCAEIASICQAAGLKAVRSTRYVIIPSDCACEAGGRGGQSELTDLVLQSRMRGSKL